MTDKLPPATLRALRVLWDTPEMKFRNSDFRRACGVKNRGFHPFNRRLEDASFIDIERDYTSLTFGGMMALRKHYTALYNERPCEANRLEMEKFARLPDQKAGA